MIDVVEWIPLAVDPDFVARAMPLVTPAAAAGGSSCEVLLDVLPIRKFNFNGAMP